MKKINFKFLPVFLMLIAITSVLNSCASGTPKKMLSEFSEENKAIPPQFGKNNTVLLCVIKGRGSYDNYLKKAAKKYYMGECVFVSKEEEKSPKYADKGKYRYYFDYSEGATHTQIYRNANGTIGGENSVTWKRFHVYDALEDKKYESGAEFSHFAQAMNAYMANLETKRKSQLQ